MSAHSFIRYFKKGVEVDLQHNGSKSKKKHGHFVLELLLMNNDISTRVSKDHSDPLGSCYFHVNTFVNREEI